MKITSIQTQDRRFPLGPVAGSDAIHRNPVYSYAVTGLTLEDGTVATGLSFTLGAGNELVCAAACQPEYRRSELAVDDESIDWSFQLPPYSFCYSEIAAPSAPAHGKGQQSQRKNPNQMDELLSGNSSPKPSSTSLTPSPTSRLS